MVAPRLPARRFRRYLAVQLGLAGLLVSLAMPAVFVPGSRVLSAAEPDGVAIDFNRDIRPILSNSCLQCHGPDEQERHGAIDGLRLDQAADATMDLGGYAAIVPGDPDSSELIRRVTSDDDGERMPPPEFGGPLSEREVELLRNWIASGAEYETHWAYLPPRRSPLPEVQRQDWPRNEIDFFILQRLEAEGLAPSPEADRTTLIRRLALDLTGLPPTLDEVDAFLNDTNPDAYERLVERFLKKESYGEHWARKWLDLARYADSAGYADDPPRTIWAYRDYVIRSFNENKPFDQFTREQLAGDLFPEPTDEQLIATAFHRNTLTNNEGGTNDEEFRNVAVVDRVNTTMAVWMGTTMACAQCHTHKYDPITQEEYFQFFAIFNNTADADRRDESPLLEIYTEQQKQRRRELEQQRVVLEKTLSELAPELHAGFRDWHQRVASGVHWETLVPQVATSEEGTEFDFQDDHAIRAGRKGSRDTYVIELSGQGDTDKDSRGPLTAIRLESLPQSDLPSGGAGHGGGNFVISDITLHLLKAGENEAAENQEEAKQGPKNEGEAAKEGVGEEEQEERNNKPPIRLKSAHSDYAQQGFDPQFVIENPDKKTKGWAVGGSIDQSHALTLVLQDPISLDPGDRLRVQIEQASQFEHHTLGSFRLSATSATDVATVAGTPPRILRRVRNAGPDEMESPSAAVAEYYVRQIAPELREQREQLAAIQEELANLKPTTTVPIMRELSEDQRRTTHIQFRGNFLDLGPEVTPALPAAFHPAPANVPLDRLALADWLMSDDNPLVGRVIANRYWENIFGIGLVRSSEEFGSQGDLPSHPELLDWLALELPRNQWDLKSFLTLLVTSATYRQASHVTPEMYERDPDNRLLARGPRFRLPAEAIRDQALSIGGLLSRKMFGPPAQPPQPSLGLSAAFGSGIDWKTSEGEDRYRRGLYTNWRRSNPYPSMVTFDAPNREVCTVQRSRSNTPLQALVTLNDPVFVEAAQALGRRMKSHSDDLSKQLDFGLRLSLARPPIEAEMNHLQTLYETARQRYQQDRPQAIRMAGIESEAQLDDDEVATLAALTVVGNVLLNLDEMFMKR
jgi:hypothetical protein